ncbi:class I SAM-dependent methyltransferase [Paenibacillus lycopersici]|uniref:Class I SAM-dependent methyltransferase n=1 Tax=Paenibacillus lycopersici TaxID=2704462 RepID=A0A6C0G0L7_9BACL|nr:class I SAM-dependent methyltransferase [Paenibacillus lycopersici]QHT62407.1 class I SAM-dependent methyltransferase [Paenibacillus lycopersici]
MKQNKYDDAGFFANYSLMARSVDGLDAAGEWQSFRRMLPDLTGKRVLDIGCGYGWHCRYAREQEAAEVVGIDISEKMLARAGELTDDPKITYRRLAIEDLDYPAGSFDVIISSLALHYIEHIDAVCKEVYRLLAPGGSFVFSTEHPVFTARAAQDWHYGADGEKLHWPVDDYSVEGMRETRFLENDVIKYHRTVSTMLNALIEAGFVIRKLSEPQPPKAMLDTVPGMRDELRRPMFLMIAADRNA